MIESAEVKQKGTSIKPVAAFCDICGEEIITPSNNRVAPSRFERTERNTPDNVISEHAAFNDRLTTGIADLCDDHAKQVADYIDSLARRSQKGWSRGARRGVRAPDKYGW